MMMRGEIFKHKQIVAATLFSVVIVAGAYFLARGIQSPSVVQASTETALLQAIASKDSDNDGLPDWEESLYGTDPHVADTFHLGMTDGEAVAKGLIVPKAIADISVATSTPTTNSNIDYAAAGLTPPTEGTLTDAFAKEFFTLYVSAKQANGGNDLTSDQATALAGEAVNQLSQTITPTADFKKAADIKVSGTGPDALRAYAAAAEAVMIAYYPSTQLPKNQLQYLQNYLDSSDQSALKNLRTIADFYRLSAVGLAVLTVPNEMATTHLALVNAFARVGEEISDFSRVDSDPLATMLALNQHTQTVTALAKAFTDIASQFATEGVMLAPGTKGASFVNVISAMNARSSPQTP